MSKSELFYDGKMGHAECLLTPIGRHILIIEIPRYGKNINVQFSFIAVAPFTNMV